MKPNLPRFPLYLIGAIAVFYVLSIGRSLIIPFIIALLLWFAIISLTEFFRGFRFTKYIAIPLSMGTYALFFWFVSEIINSNVSQVVALAPKYQTRVSVLLSDTFNYLKISEIPSISTLFESIDISLIISSIAGSILSIFSNAGIILIYLLFLLLESKYFMRKIDIALAGPQLKKTKEVIASIKEDIRSYFAIKTLVSCITAVLSYIVLALFDVDFAVFWAFLIFLFNFIPTIGSIVAVFFPLTLAVVQFESYYPLVGLATGLIAVQIIVGNIIDPKLTGNRLNLSPLVILISLAFWGSLWGVIGMLLSVPITVIINIVLSEFKCTRPISVFLSEKGYVKGMGMRQLKIFRNAEQHDTHKRTSRRVRKTEKKSRQK